MTMPIRIICFLFFVACFSTVSSQTKTTGPKDPNSTGKKITTDRSDTSRPTKPRKFRYRPPKRGAPRTREASAARGTEDSLPKVVVLAPMHTGLTNRAYPTLAWHQDKTARATFVLTLTNEDTFDTLMELKFTRHASAGIHQFDLSCLEIPLKTEVEYRWSIGVVTGDEHASGDPYSAAHIKRAEGSDEQTSQLKNAGKMDRIAILAEHSVWYDALAELSELIAVSPDELSLQKLRSQLLTDAEVFNIQATDSKVPVIKVNETKPAAKAKDSASSSSVASIPAKTGKVRYRPPKRGAPLTREASAARGAEDTMPNLSVLAPTHTGWTAQTHPTLFWHQDKPVRTTFLLTLTNQDTFETLMELKFTKQSSAGIKSFDLACLGIPLDADVEYGWSIGIITGEEHASGDPYSAAHIRKVTKSDELIRFLKKTDRLERVSLLAEHGIWYEALAELSDLIAASPEDRSLQELRSQLLSDAEVFDNQVKK